MASRRNNPRDKGTVLLMALLILSGVLIASSGLGTLILSSLRQTRIIDNAITAYYAAESGAEDALYAVRRQGVLPDSVSTPVTLSNAATWTRDVTNTEPVLFTDIPRDSTKEILLYDPDNENVSPGIARVNISWNDGCSGCTVLTTNAVSWSTTAPFAWVPNAATFQYAGGTAQVSLEAPQKLYRLRLRADNGDMTDVRIEAFDTNDQPVSLPGRVKIDARGDFVGVRQTMTVTLPRKSPVSGLYDFAIFSECSLVKGGPVSCP